MMTVFDAAIDRRIGSLPMDQIDVALRHTLVRNAKSKTALAFANAVSLLAHAIVIHVGCVGNSATNSSHDATSSAGLTRSFNWVSVQLFNCS